MNDLAEIVGSYREDGFAVVRGVYSPPEISAFEHAIDRCASDMAGKLGPGDIYFEDVPGRPMKSIFRLERYEESLAALLTDPRLLDMASAVYDDAGVALETVMCFGKPARSGSVTPPHQDNAFQSWDPPEAMTITIAVDASTADNGVLICQRGSHKAGLLPHQPSGVMGFSQMLIDTPDTAEYPEEEIRMVPGDVFLHSVHTVHRSGANHTDRSRRQLAIMCRSSRAKVDEERQAKTQEILRNLHADNAGRR